MGAREIAPASFPAYSLGGYIAAWRRAMWLRNTGHGFLVWIRTVKGSTISTRSIGANDEEPRSLLAGLARRSMLNLTESAVKSSPLWNLTPRRSLNSQVVGATSFGISVASAGTSLRFWSRSSRDSNICAPTLDAGCSCWFIMSSEVGSTPCAITTLPAGAAPTLRGTRTRERRTTAVRQWLMCAATSGRGSARVALLYGALPGESRLLVAGAEDHTHAQGADGSPGRGVRAGRLPVPGAGDERRA